MRKQTFFTLLIFFFALLFLIVFGQQGCIGNVPAQKQKPIIDKDTNINAFEGQHRIVLK